MLKKQFSKMLNKQKKKSKGKPKQKKSKGKQFSISLPNPQMSLKLKKSGISSGSMGQRGRLMKEVTRIPYREECLGTISTSVNFSLSSLILNAGNTTTFPWLASIAAKWEFYKFNKLHLRFVSSSADAVGSTNTALGTMIFNTNYDVLDPVFASQIEMEAYGGGRRHAETIPSRNIVHYIEPAGERGGVAGGWRYILPGGATTAAGVSYPTYSSAHDYDIGLLQTASSGAQAASVAGRLYICYQVDLANPKLVPGAIVGGAAHWSAIAATSANNFGLATLQAGNTLTGITMTGSTITFPAGQSGNYFVAVAIAGATSASSVYESSVTGGVTILNLQTQSAVRDSIAQQVSVPGTTTNAAISFGTVSVTGAGGTMVFTASTIVGTGSADIWIFSLPSTVLTMTLPRLYEEEQSNYNVMSSRLERLERMLSKNEVKEIESDREDSVIIGQDLTASYISRVGEALGVVRSIRAVNPSPSRMG